MMASQQEQEHGIKNALLFNELATLNQQADMKK